MSEPELPAVASAHLPPLVLAQVHRLAGGDQHQQAPQVVAVTQLGEAALGGAAAEAVEGAQGGVLLVLVDDALNFGREAQKLLKPALGQIKRAFEADRFKGKRVGLVGAGMICDETHLPLLDQLRQSGLIGRHGPVAIELAAVASRTGRRSERLRERFGAFENCVGPDAAAKLAALPLDAIIVATPDDRHFDAARAALAAGKKEEAKTLHPKVHGGILARRADPDHARAMAEHGIVFGEPSIDLERLRGWKNGVVRKLTGGLKMLAKQRKVEVVLGEAQFVSPNAVSVTTGSVNPLLSSCPFAMTLPLLSRIS